MQNSLLQKLCNIQSNLKAPKGQFNSFGKYKYRSCEDILESLKPLLEANNCALTISDEVVLVDNRFYVKATAFLHDCESGGQINNTAFAREEEAKKGMDGSQITGTASSYARKYALNGLFCIDDTKDADSNEFKETEPEYLCEQCGVPFRKVVTETFTYTPADIFNRSKAKNGRALCKKCVDKLANGSNTEVKKEKETKEAEVKKC